MSILLKRGYKRLITRVAEIFQVARSSLYYVPRRNTEEEEEEKLASQIRELALKNPTAGYRTIHQQLLEKGFRVSLKKVYRIYREPGLAIGSAIPGRKRKRKEKPEEEELSRGQFVHDAWALDFTSLKKGKCPGSGS